MSKRKQNFSNKENKSSMPSTSKQAENQAKKLKLTTEIPKPMDSKEAIKTFKELLKNNSNPGDYSVSGEATELPSLPNLCVDKIGRISLPLTEHQAQDLIKVGIQAPFGLNQETIVDTKVRDSFQFDPSQIEIKHPDWTRQLNLLVQRVAKKMGCSNRNVSAKLYKMLLYKQGSHFLKHRDTEKEKNMFATLVVQLPSDYTGGEFIVYYGDKKKIYDFGQSTGKQSYAMHYTVHYADLEHEIKPVTSGYRLALVYSLSSGQKIDDLIQNYKTTERFKDCLNQLARLKKPFAITLDHQYTHESLSNCGVLAFKGVDTERYNFLKAASMRLSDENQLCFFIVKANLTIEQTDYEYEYILILINL